MIKHVVMWKFKDDVAEADKLEMKRQLESLKGVVPTLVDIEVGMDIVGDKLMEINVFSPGGIHSASQLEDVNFTREVIHALEHKVDAMHRYHRNFDNVEMATL